MESVLYCEGYDDRAFLTAALTRLGCTDLGRNAGPDPWGKPVSGGHFALRSKNHAFIRVVPVREDNQMQPTALARWKERETKPLKRLVCLALRQTYPACASEVTKWLQPRNFEPGSDQAKAHAWSHMAGWYPGWGCESFYRAVWEDTALAEALESVLGSSGSWATLASVAES